MNLPYVVEDLEFPLGHASFAIAKDMTWFSKDVVDIVNKYNSDKVNLENTVFEQWRSK